LRLEHLRAEALVAVRALDIEHLALLRRVGHVFRVAADAVRTAS
jgi:hypothetical protein